MVISFATITFILAVAHAEQVEEKDDQSGGYRVGVQGYKGNMEKVPPHKAGSIGHFKLSKEATDAGNARKALVREGTTLTTIEEKAEGDVMWPTYSYYIKAGGLGKFCLIMLFICLYQALVVVASYWLAYWGTVNTRSALNGNPLTIDENVYFLDYYALYTMMGVVALTVRSVALAQHRLGTSVKMHEEMVDSVFGAPVAFFDVTPQGRLLNRFSSDMVVVDEELSQSISQLTNSLFSVFGAIAAIAAATQGIFLGLCVPLVILYEKIQRYFRKSNTAIARLQSVSLSPIYTDFSQVRIIIGMFDSWITVKYR